MALAEWEAEEVVADADELELVGFEVEDEEVAEVEEVDDGVGDVLILHWPFLSQ